MFDVFVGIIIIGSMVLGARSGFIYTFIHTIGWFIAGLLGFVLLPDVKDIILEKTPVYDTLTTLFYEKFSGYLGIDSTFGNLPSILGEAVNTAAASMTTALSERFTDICITIFAFSLIVIAVKLVLWLVLRLLSKRHREGVLSLFDSALGMVFGLIKGILLVFVVMALLVPLSSLLPTYLVADVMTSLQESTFAFTLYDNNLLLLVVQGFLSQ